MQSWKVILLLVAGAVCVQTAHADKASKNKCPEGQAVSEYTKGQCCWPGQGWNGSKCVGTPTSCPEGYLTGADQCEEKGCEPGQIKLEGKHCCWPGQAWAGRCVGTPECPKGTLADADSCMSLGEMVSVPAGEFWMGCATSDSKCMDTEKPGHTVYLDAFQIDKTEVTVDAYAVCVKAGQCSEPSKAGYGTWGEPDKGNHPVNYVDWNQANNYCKWAGKQLPTEAQWEKAARGTDGRIYPWGNDEASCEFPSYAVMNGEKGYGCGARSTMPVGSKPNGASPYGALDMSGSVEEWTADWFHISYDTPSGVPSVGASSVSRNPTGPASGTLRVHRGGSFDDSTISLRASTRAAYKPTEQTYVLGFRCAVSISP